VDDASILVNPHQGIIVPLTTNRDRARAHNFFRKERLLGLLDSASIQYLSFSRVKLGTSAEITIIMPPPLPPLPPLPSSFMKKTNSFMMVDITDSDDDDEDMVFPYRTTFGRSAQGIGAGGGVPMKKVKVDYDKDSKSGSTVVAGVFSSSAMNASEGEKNSERRLLVDRFESSTTFL